MVIINDAAHCPKLMEELWRQAKESPSLTDVVLSYDGMSFNAHACVLAIAAPKLLRQFEVLAVEGQVNLKKLDVYIPAELLEEVLHFLYTGHIQIPDECVDEVLSFAKKFAIDSILELCDKITSRGQDESAEMGGEGDKTVTILIDSERNEPDNAGIKQSSPDAPRFRCLHCRQIFDRSLDLSKHYAREICKDKDNASSQQSSHDAQVFCCLECRQAFLSSLDLSKHHATGICKDGGGRHNERKIREISQSEVRNGNLKSISDGHAVKNPKRNHLRREPHNCQECNKIYKTKLGLQMHIDSVHLQKFPYECKECGRGFAQKSHLRDHNRVHSKEKNHVCSFCGIFVSTKINLKRHESIHTGIRHFACTVCRKRFAVPHDLKRHVQTQHSQAGTVCEVCGKTFKRSSRLTQHKKMAHPNEKRAVKPVVKSELGLDNFPLPGVNDGTALSQAGDHIGSDNSMLGMIQQQPLINSMWKDEPFE